MSWSLPHPLNHQLHIFPHLILPYQFFPLPHLYMYCHLWKIMYPVLQFQTAPCIKSCPPFQYLFPFQTLIMSPSRSIRTLSVPPPSRPITLIPYLSCSDLHHYPISVLQLVPISPRVLVLLCAIPPVFFHHYSIIQFHFQLVWYA